MNSIDTWHKNWNKIRMVQCVLDAMTAVVVFLIVRLICPASIWPAVIGASFYAFSFINIYFACAILMTTVMTFLAAWLMFFSVLTLKKDRKMWPLLTGVTLGLAALTRQEYIYFIFFLALYMFCFHHQSKSAVIKKIFIVTFGLVITVVPWSVRNYMVFKKPILVATGMIGFVLYQGTYETKNTWNEYGNIPQEIFSSKKEKDDVEFIRDLSFYHMQRGSILTQEMDKVFMKLALKRIKDNPFLCFKKWLSMIPFLWRQDYLRLAFPSIKVPLDLFVFHFLFALGAVILGTRQERSMMAPILLLFIYINLLFFPLHVEPRYGAVMMPGLLGLTGIGFYKAFIWIRTKGLLRQSR